MAMKIVLTVTSNGAVRRFEVDKPIKGLLGREHSSMIRFPDEEVFSDISRRHCLLEIDPPCIRLRDLGSLNGTFVNGALIGKRPGDMEPELVGDDFFESRDLKDGDIVKIGFRTRMRVEIFDPGECVDYGDRNDPSRSPTLAQIEQTAEELSTSADTPTTLRSAVAEDASLFAERSG